MAFDDPLKRAMNEKAAQPAFLQSAFSALSFLVEIFFETVFSQPCTYADARDRSSIYILL
jgi:histone H3/H4